MASLYSAGRARFSESGLADAANHGQRRAKLVRRVGRKSAKLIERRLESCEGLVDHRRKPSDFVVLIRDGQAFVQPFGGNAASLRCQMVNRCERPPCQHIATDSGEDDDERKAEHEDDEDFPQLARAAASSDPRDPQHDCASAHQGRARQRPPAYDHSPRSIRTAAARMPPPAPPEATLPTRRTGTPARRWPARRRCPDPRRCPDRDGCRRTMRRGRRWSRVRKPSAVSKSSCS